MRRAVLAAILLLPLLGGCAGTKWAGTPNEDQRTWFAEAGFTAADLEGRTLAVGGVLLRDRAPLDPFCGIGLTRRQLTHEAQADLWSPDLDGALLALTPGSRIRMWPEVRASVPTDLVAATHAAYARRSLVRPELLAGWAKGLPDVDYLVLARIEDTWIDGTGQSDWSRVEGLGRVVAVTLDVYDLKTGRSVWSAMNQEHRRSGMTAPVGGDPDGGPPAGVDANRTTKAAPTLQAGLGKALGAVVTQLRRTGAPGEVGADPN